MLSAMPKTVLIVPCYNEGSRLPSEEIARFAGQQENLTLLLVNDGSSDNTAEVIDQLAADNDNIKSMHLKQNSGKAEAVRQGVLSSVDSAPAFIGFWDADLATPFSELENFLAKFQLNTNYQAVIGCRLARLGANVHRQPARHYLGRVFATVVSFLLGLRVYDTQCGAKVFKTELAAKIFAQPFLSQWLFDVELFKRIITEYGKDETSSIIYEYPLNQWEDVSGSKLGFSKMLRVPFQLMRIFLKK